MPIYEYVCEDCKKEFEELVFGDETPECPACKSSNTHKLLSATKFKMAGGGGFSAPTGSSGGSSCSGCSGGNCSTCG